MIISGGSNVYVQDGTVPGMVTVLASGEDVHVDVLGSVSIDGAPMRRDTIFRIASISKPITAVTLLLVQVMRTRLFEPLGMRTTAFWTPETDRVPTQHRPTEAGLELFDPPNGMWSSAPAFGDGSAGLVSTIDDVLAFARMMARGGQPLLDHALWAEATRSHLPDELYQATVKDFMHGRRWGYCMSVIPDGPQAGAGSACPGCPSAPWISRS
jgi:CubicO group peptidase (beta-lactamase class C family)